jgi:transposase
VTAATLVTGLPELGTLDRRKLAALVGIAPLNCDSGDRHAPRRCWGGRAEIRVSLYMATLAGIKHSPLIRARYRALRQRGKPGLVAIVACMRQLLTILNAIARSGTSFEPSRWAQKAA